MAKTLFDVVLIKQHSSPALVYKWFHTLHGKPDTCSDAPIIQRRPGLYDVVNKY